MDYLVERPMDYQPYNDHYGNAPAAQTGARGERSAVFLIILVAISVIALAATMFWLGAKFPYQVRELIISVDRFGITDAGAQEQNRIRLINRLSITYEEKQVLINRTVFLNATREMVLLALGNPVCAFKTEAGNNAPEFWIYYIRNESKPTQLQFVENQLTSATKISALDACK